MRLVAMMVMVLGMVGCAGPIDIPDLEGEDVAVRIEPVDGEAVEFRCSGYVASIWTMGDGSEMVGVGCDQRAEDGSLIALGGVQAHREPDGRWSNRVVDPGELEPGTATIEGSLGNANLSFQHTAARLSINIEDGRAEGSGWGEWEDGAVAIRFDAELVREN